MRLIADWVGGIQWSRIRSLIRLAHHLIFVSSSTILIKILGRQTLADNVDQLLDEGIVLGPPRVDRWCSWCLWREAELAGKTGGSGESWVNQVVADCVTSQKCLNHLCLLACSIICGLLSGGVVASSIVTKRATKSGSWRSTVRVGFSSGRCWESWVRGRGRSRRLSGRGSSGGSGSSCRGGGRNGLTGRGVCDWCSESESGVVHARSGASLTFVNVGTQLMQELVSVEEILLGSESWQLEVSVLCLLLAIGATGLELSIGTVGNWSNAWNNCLQVGEPLGHLGIVDGLDLVSLGIVKELVDALESTLLALLLLLWRLVLLLLLLLLLLNDRGSSLSNWLLNVKLWESTLWIVSSKSGCGKC